MYPPVKWFYVLVAYLITPLFALPNSYGEGAPRAPGPGAALEEQPLEEIETRAALDAPSPPPAQAAA